jgi:hypothetical protein
MLSQKLDTDFIVRVLAPTLANGLRNNGIVVEAADGAKCDMMPNAFIFAYRDRAWTIWHDLSVSEIDEYFAIGSGSDVARGVLYATPDKNPFERIVTSIEAAAESTLYVDNGISLSAYAPSLYMLEDGYITNISGVATDGTKYNVVDASIPFYQLVLSGKVNYSSKAINLEDVYSLDYHKLKAIETGSSLNFTLSHDKTDKLIKTDFNYYYNTYYGYFSEKIKDLYNELNQIGYASANLIDHEILANDIVKVTYSNGVSITLNYSHQEYNGISPLGYKVE